MRASVLFVLAFQVLHGPVNSQTGCGGDLASNTGGPETSPNFPNNYNNNEVCEWSITVSTGKAILLTFDSFNLQEHSDFLIIYDGPHTGAAEIQRLTGHQHVDPITSTSNTMFLRFISDGSGTAEGFKFSYTSVLPDPCNTYITISEPLRSIEYEVTPGAAQLCDSRLQRHWYRFDSPAGNEMPTSCVPQYHCGTTFPVWMNGQHPTNAGEEAQVELCVNANMPPDHCCYSLGNTEVKKCAKGTDEFYVYYLGRLPSCYMAYCAGDRIQCGAGTTSIIGDGYSPCAEHFPIFEQVHLEGPTPTTLPNDKPGHFYFECVVTYNAIEVEKEQAVFDFRWVLDTDSHGVDAETEIQHDVTDGKTPVSKIYSDTLFGHIGKTIRCDVQSKWGHVQDAVPSMVVSSVPYFMGIQLELNGRALRTDQEITLAENARTEKTVTVVSTIPITCSAPPPAECSLPIEIKSESNDIAIKDLWDTTIKLCEVRIKREDWNPTTKRATTQYSMLAVRDMVDDDDQVFSLKFDEFSFFMSTPNVGLWRRYQIAPLRIRTEDKPTASCSATGDPHYKATDRKVTFHRYQLGTYVMFKSKVRAFEVQSKLWPCGSGSVTCNCGMAVRENNDVIIISICHGPYGQASPDLTIRTPNALADGTRITRTGGSSSTTFNIFFPSGSKVTVLASTTRLDITIHMPSDDFQNCEGLCGNFDLNDQNDFQKPDGTFHPNNDDIPDNFFESWKLSVGHSFWDRVPNQFPFPDSVYCKCIGDIDDNVNQNVIECGPEVRAERFGFGLLTGTDITETLNQRKRKKRDTTYHDEDDDSINRDLTFPDFVSIIPDWPTPSGMTEQLAEDYCKEVLRNSTMSTFCADQANVDIFSTLSQCVEDIKMSDDKEWATAALSAMEDECTTSVLTNVSMHETSANGTSVPPQALVEKLCLNQCSFKGTCVDGECVCIEGWIGKDCGVSANTGPTVWDLKRGGLCDIRQRPCEKVNVRGIGLIESENLTCRASEAKFENGTWTKTGESYQTSASFESFAEVACYLPPAKIQPSGYQSAEDGVPSYGLFISISNEGMYFSDELLLIIYDSVCQECVQDGPCSLKDDACLIRGYCFSEGDSNPTDWCEQCLSNRSTSDWSRREDNQAPSITSSPNITKVHQESLTVMLTAHDPEGRPMSFSSTQRLPHGMTLTSDGVLFWPAHSPNSLTIDVQVTDECGAQSVQTLALSTMSCPCYNGGQCVPTHGKPEGQGHYDCLCSPGFTGTECETDIDECQSSPCQNNGICIDQVNSFICNCPVGFTGDHCAVVDQCTPSPCFPGVLCQNQPDGFVCGDCPPGYDGDGATCEELPFSCNDKYQQMLNNGASPTDGVYKINIDGQATLAYCDMSRDGGGWTLLVTSKSMAGWDKVNILSYNEDSPATDGDYSILGKADRIKANISFGLVQYRLEAEAPGRWGGIWEVPVDYSFTHNMNDQYNVTLISRFDAWDYGPRSIGHRMPWIVEDPTLPAVLTTAESPDQDWYGTVVGSDLGIAAYQGFRAPWIRDLAESPSAIWYWMREWGPFGGM